MPKKKEQIGVKSGASFPQAGKSCTGVSQEFPYRPAPSHTHSHRQLLIPPLAVSHTLLVPTNNPSHLDLFALVFPPCLFLFFRMSKPGMFRITTSSNFQPFGTTYGLSARSFRPDSSHWGSSSSSSYLPNCFPSPASHFLIFSLFPALSLPHWFI